MVVDEGLVLSRAYALGIIVTRCMKVAKNGIQQRQAGLAEWTRAGAGGAVVVGSNPA